jgi:hypothetical protein
VHSEKHPQSKISTDSGITISIKEVSWNVSFSICDNLDSVSNVTEESDLHSEKHFHPKTSTDAGITISTKPD